MIDTFSCLDFFGFMIQINKQIINKLIITIHTVGYLNKLSMVNCLKLYSVNKFASGIKSDDDNWKDVKCKQAQITVDELYEWI